MTPKEAQFILENLAHGIDPVTGTALPDDVIFRAPRVLLALLMGAQGLEILALENRNLVPAQAGQPWTPDEERRLLAAFDSGIDIKEIAKWHGRSRGGITARLVRLGRIEEGSEIYAKPKRGEK
ncbi:hypothetical protein SAMN02949497_4460 [Methylomagnum ishizawai]|uniref:Homeodomain-like domain-containing protein n=1 Tax=Methylomagnum ishizawai TaxID=1760988 RepID=A0A1Y6DA27_9GAMM|nr:hypothetical protein [Methylomagnum ishizawai]SMF97044.1 hypothetical protein SAMN02949497_4460 [Methylomagnum ishizawai]